MPAGIFGKGHVLCAGRCVHCQQFPTHRSWLSARAPWSRVSFLFSSFGRQVLHDISRSLFTGAPSPRSSPPSATGERVPLPAPRLRQAGGGRVRGAGAWRAACSLLNCPVAMNHENAQRSTSNAQRSTKRRVECWTLNVERSTFGSCRATCSLWNCPVNMNLKRR